MSKNLLAVYVSVLLFSALTGAQCVDLGRANPYIRDWVEEGEVSPSDGTLPPTILILSPENNTAYVSNNVSLTFNVTMPESKNVSLQINKIYYRESWQRLRDTYVDLKTLNYKLPQLSINLTGVPEGPRWLEVYVIAKGFSHETRQVLSRIVYTTYYVSYKIIGSSIVHFIIDNTPPIISALSVENKTYYSLDVPLNLIVNEPVSQVTYSLDRQTNVTLTENTTLTNLSDGFHSLIVYAKDIADNVGASETIYFTVVEPFPTTWVIVSAAITAVVIVGLSVYFVKSKKKAKKQ